MQNQVKTPIHPLMWVAGIALIVFCGAGAAAFMGWIPGSAGKPVAAGPIAKVDKPRNVERAKTICTQCGVVQSVQEADTKGEGSGIGVVGGAVAGGVLGSQVGHGDGTKVATVVGAVGGAVLGNEIEKRVRSTKSYEITVRFDDGSSRVITEQEATTWRAGDKVKLVNGIIQSNV